MTKKRKLLNNLINNKPEQTNLKTKLKKLISKSNCKGKNNNNWQLSSRK